MMNDSAEEQHSTIQTGETQLTAVKNDKPEKCHRICYLLKHIIRFFAIIGCFVGCCYFLIISANRLNSDMILQEFKATSSVGNENLQITVCPVAPFEQVLALDFKVHTRRANRLRFYNMALMNRPHFSKGLIKAIDCLVRSQYVHTDASLEEKLNALKHQQQCAAYASPLFSADYLQDVMEIYTWIRSYLALYMLDLHKEGDVDFYEGVYKNIDILKQDNATLPEFLKSAARGLENYILSGFAQTEDVNLNQPAQKIVVNSLRTRFGPSCLSYTMAGNEDGQNKLNQRYQLQMTFNRVELAYLLVFVNENRTFSDIPGASILQPYRIPLDTSSVLHIRRIEKTIKNEQLEHCKSYDKRSSPGSHVECMEACLLKKVVTNENITCLMPWMERNSTRGLTNKPFCSTSEDYLNTRHITQQIFGGNISDCNNICTESCEKLNILVKIMGIVRPATFNDDQRHSLIIIVSNEMDEFRNRPAYGWGEFTAEVFGSLSFILGIAFVALIEWIFATIMWLFGKLPYIPAMPPIINSDVYIRDIYYQVRHELYGEPIPMTISQTYFKTHEQRRDAFHAAPSTTEKTVSDHQHPQFPRMHQRKSSLAIIQEAFAAVSHQHEEAILQEQFKSLSEILSRRRASESGKLLEKRSSFPPDCSYQRAQAAAAQPTKATRSSVHGMPTKWSEPRITISAPDEEAHDTEHKRHADESTPGGEAEDAGQTRQPEDASGLPGIERERRPSRAVSVLRDLDAAEASGAAEAEAEAEAAPPSPPAAVRERKRSSVYRTKPRRKSAAVAPAPTPSHPEHGEDEEPPD